MTCKFKDYSRAKLNSQGALNDIHSAPVNIEEAQNTENGALLGIS